MSGNERGAMASTNGLVGHLANFSPSMGYSHEYISFKTNMCNKTKRSRRRSIQVESNSKLHICKYAMAYSHLRRTSAMGVHLFPRGGAWSFSRRRWHGNTLCNCIHIRDYKKNQLTLRHWTFSWDEIYEAIYDPKSHAIGFNVNEAKPYIARFKEENENFYGGRIYFHPKMAEQILQIFKEKLGPNTPIKEGRIHYRGID